MHEACALLFVTARASVLSHDLIEARSERESAVLGAALIERVGAQALVALNHRLEYVFVEIGHLRGRLLSSTVGHLKQCDANMTRERLRFLVRQLGRLVRARRLKLLKTRDFHSRRPRRTRGDQTEPKQGKEHPFHVDSLLGFQRGPRRARI